MYNIIVVEEHKMEKSSYSKLFKKLDKIVYKTLTYGDL
jgi:hypothetical protein